MLYTFIALIVLVPALFIAYKALRLLFRGTWFAAWLKGTAGIALLAVSVFIGLIAWDLLGYSQALKEQNVATLTFTQIEPQHFEVKLVDAKGNEQQYKLRGDQWQLDARLVKFKGYLARFGAHPGYRLERLSGRYYRLDQELSAERTVYQLGDSLYGVDAWRWVNEHPTWLPVVDAVYGSATYLPLADKAVYEVSLSHTGLLARPVNAAAEAAVNRWQ